MRNSLFPLILGIASIAVAASTARADDDGRSGGRVVEYEVSITNLTRDQQFTPFLIVTHRPGLILFEAGEPASPELEVLAEEGDTAPFAARLAASPGVRAIEVTSGLLDPGATVSRRIEGVPGREEISLAAMLIPTNDGFTGLVGLRLPARTVAQRTPAYDAGSERNDELCSSIPGPSFDECGGPGGGGQVSGGEEGFVHVHSGVHGGGDFDAAERDWRNPVAAISIRRLGREE